MVARSPFEAALQEALARLLAAHTASVSTMEAELVRMRTENTLLRMRLAEAGVQIESGKLSIYGDKRTVPPEPQASAPAASEALEEAPPAATAVAAVELKQGETAAPPLPLVAKLQPAQDLAEDLEVQELVRPLPPIVSSPSGLPSSMSSASSISPAEIARALRSILDSNGLQDVKVMHNTGTGCWLVGGISLQLRCDEHTSGEGTGPLRALQASGDGGQTWWPVEEILRQRAARSLAAPGGPSRAALEAPPEALGDNSPEGPPESQRPGEWLRVQAFELPGASMARSPTSVPVHDPELPAYRADGLPTFHNAFPASFSALSGASNYYSQFRVRVPFNSQYDQQ